MTRGTTQTNHAREYDETFSRDMRLSRHGCAECGCVVLKQGEHPERRLRHDWRRRWALPSKSPLPDGFWVFLDLSHLKIFFAGAAFRTNPVGRNVFPFGARGNTFIRHTGCFIVYPTANQTNPSIHSELLPEKKLQRVDNTEFGSRLQRLSVFFGF